MPEKVELMLPESDALEFLKETQALHDEFKSKYPDIMRPYVPPNPDNPNKKRRLNYMKGRGEHTRAGYAATSRYGI